MRVQNTFFMGVTRVYQLLNEGDYHFTEGKFEAGLKAYAAAEAMAPDNPRRCSGTAWRWSTWAASKIACRFFTRPLNCGQNGGTCCRGCRTQIFCRMIRTSFSRFSGNLSGRPIPAPFPTKASPLGGQVCRDSSTRSRGQQRRGRSKVGRHRSTRLRDCLETWRRGR